jgi:diguanylate cyclase (GGDEF)-like protein/PAS domain S-box-containing protein
MLSPIMTDTQIRVLIVEDVPTDAELALRELKKAGLSCKTIRVENKADYLRHLDDFVPDVILSDFSLPHFDGKSALVLARDKCPDVPFIFVSGTIGEETAIESLKSGATDYILKTNLARLGPAVQRALQDARDRGARWAAEYRVRELQERFELFMLYLPGIAFIKDSQGRYQFMNRAWEKFAGIKASVAIGRTEEELWPELGRQHQQSERAVFEENKVVETLNTYPDQDGVHTFLVHSFPILDAEGRVSLVGGVAVDLTERLRAEEKVVRLSRMQGVLSDINSTIVRVRDRDKLFHEACRIAVEGGGFKLAWVGLVDGVTGDIRPHTQMGEDGSFLRTIHLSVREDLPRGQGVSGMAFRSRKPIVVNDVASDGRLYHKKETLLSGFRAFIVMPLLVESEPIGSLYFYADQVGFFDQAEVQLLTELAGDISFALEYIEKEDRLNYLAYYDVLTGLPNRNLFSESANQLVHAALHDNSQVALIVLDLQRFATINDTLGRPAGDDVLRKVAKRLRHALEERHLVARVGADLFAILLADVKDAAGVAHLLEREIIDAIGRPISVSGQELRPFVRCGVALFPADGADAEVLYRNAEAARKKARQSGDRYLFYAPQMNAMVAEKLDLENKLRVAIANEQFVLHYQPKVSIASGRVVGIEALIRWQSPDLGLVTPHRFIPLLEETGMILDAGRWALRQAVRDFRQWVAKGLQPPRIAVNISSQQLRQKDFVEETKEIIVQGDGETPAIDLEITESLIMENIDQCSAKLDMLKSAGIGIAIDDFGTGYSSLSYLARLPVSSLKIDRSFIVDMTNNPDHMAIVSTVILLAHSLNLTVTAEGVETQEQLNLLKLLKCDEMQGYLFSKPLPAAQVEAMFGGATEV